MPVFIDSDSENGRSSRRRRLNSNLSMAEALVQTKAIDQEGTEKIWNYEKKTIKRELLCLSDLKKMRIENMSKLWLS